MSVSFQIKKLGKCLDLNQIIIGNFEKYYYEVLDIWYFFSLWKMYNPLITIKIIPIQTFCDGISFQIRNPQKMLKGSATYSYGAMIEASVFLYAYVELKVKKLYTKLVIKINNKCL